MKLKIIALLLILAMPLLSRPPKASLPEIKFALLHPFAALKIKRITKKCEIAFSPAFIKTELDSFGNGGKADAYRHSFFMAAYAQKIKVRKLRKLGQAHEKGNYRQFLKSKAEEGEMADSLSCVMDLKNNELGFEVGSQNKKITLINLSKLIVAEIKTGKAVIIKRDQAGNYVDCQGKKIDLNLYRGKWVVPKCLVSSDYAL